MTKIKNGKRKNIAQRAVVNRINFLYQAANLMAHDNKTTLAAYYGKLCRKVGTKAVKQLSPTLKRTLCKRCSLPLLPGVNTTLELHEKSEREPKEKNDPNSMQVDEETVIRKRPRHRRQRTKRVNKEKKASAEILNDNLQVQVECSLCGARRQFQVDPSNECWPERTEAIVRTVTLQRD